MRRFQFDIGPGRNSSKLVNILAKPVLSKDGASEGFEFNPLLSISARWTR